MGHALASPEPYRRGAPLDGALRASVMLNLRSLLPALALLLTAAAGAAQKLPREDVVEVPARTEGLCVSNLFQSHMVLQRDRPAALWGWGEPGAAVAVSFADAEAEGRCDGDGAWRVELPALAASAEGRTLSVRSGDAELLLDDVLVGDVWVLGGQSNMEFELAKVENGELEIATANYDQLRILTVPYGEGPRIQRGFARLHEWSSWFGRHFRKGDWDVCRPEVARELSAIGFVFARRLHMATRVPIGVIDASRGGTTVETWTPREVLDGLPGAAVQERLADWDERVATWDPQADLATRVRQAQERRARLEAEGNPIPEDQREDPTDLRPGPIADHNLPGSCYAGMIGPLRGLSIRGAIFHQGYNNALDGMPGVRLYEEVLPAMIAAWREAFGNPELPFGLLSLCTDGYPQTRDDYCETMFNAGIYIRAAQYQTFLDLWEAGDRNIGFASTYDLRRRWYHPQVKLPAGERIARWALSTQYGFGRQLPWKPPALLELVQEESHLVLRLDAEVGDPMDGAIEGFAIAGEDGRFQPAKAEHLQVGVDDRGRPRLDRRQLVLSSPLVPAPLHFRYAWGRNPMGNLQLMGNKDLPFATQRSDAWGLAEAPRGVLEEVPEGKLSRRDQNRIREALRQDDLRRRRAEARALLEELGDDPDPQDG